MESGAYLDVIADRSRALLNAARADLDAPVPSCPGWKVADLVDHAGGTWGWAAAIVQTGARADYTGAPDGCRGAELIAWAEDRSRQLLTALEGSDPGSDCWTFGLPRTVLFWFRRQALETTVHAWDAEQAVGVPEPIDPLLASDGIDEFLAVMVPRQIKAHAERWSGESFHFHCTDTDGEWLVRLGPDGAVSVDLAHGKADVAIRGPASPVYLWCLNRVPAQDVEVIGEGALARRWTSEIVF
ncbi:MAG: maleylpyruvate isomerase family mycothiol-dependent enzyme [Acidimicrobiales bacterium]